MSRRIIVSASTLLIIAPLLIHAQSEWGNITGVVTDPTMAVIPGAEVTVIATVTNSKKTTTSVPGVTNNTSGSSFASFLLGEAIRGRCRLGSRSTGSANRAQRCINPGATLRPKVPSLLRRS